MVRSCLVCEVSFVDSLFGSQCSFACKSRWDALKETERWKRRDSSPRFRSKKISFVPNLPSAEAKQQFKKERRAEKKRKASWIIDDLRRKLKSLERRLEDSKKARDPHPFYDSEAWQRLRYQALKLYGRICLLCKTTKGEMHVDHIKPRSKYPELELDINNLQVLCRSCNLGKSNRDETDWRNL